MLIGVQQVKPSSCLQAVLWRYKFSQLKGSSDDGKSKIKFLFQNTDSKAIEAKVSSDLSVSDFMILTDNLDHYYSN